MYSLDYVDKNIISHHKAPFVNEKNSLISSFSETLCVVQRCEKQSIHISDTPFRLVMMNSLSLIVAKDVPAMLCVSLCKNLFKRNLVSHSKLIFQFTTTTILCF